MSNINASTFAKADTGKPKISLVPTQIIRDIARVRMYGDQKYHAPFNWSIVEMDRYKDAMMRHLLAFLDDPTSIDEESGIPHYMHAACNMAFICEMMRPDWEERKQYYYEHDEKLRNQIEEYEKKVEEAQNYDSQKFDPNAPVVEMVFDNGTVRLSNVVKTDTSSTKYTSTGNVRDYGNTSIINDEDMEDY